MTVETSAVCLDEHWFAFECTACGPLCLVANLDIARGISAMHMALSHGVHVTP